MGRSIQYSNPAERQRAYRQRLALKGLPLAAQLHLRARQQHDYIRRLAESGDQDAALLLGSNYGETALNLMVLLGLSVVEAARKADVKARARIKPVM
jgi:hypothetical protein